MKGVGGLAPVGLRMREPGNDFEKLHDGARPAVGEEKREGVLVNCSQLNSQSSSAIRFP